MPYRRSTHDELLKLESFSLMKFELPRVFMLIDVGMRKTLSGTALFFLRIRCLWLSNVPTDIIKQTTRNSHEEIVHWCRINAPYRHDPRSTVGMNCKEIKHIFRLIANFYRLHIIKVHNYEAPVYLVTKISFRDSIVLHSSNSLSAFDTVDSSSFLFQQPTFIKL